MAPFSDEQLHELLLVARSHNTRHGLTGILLYGNNQFMQVLEGEEPAVRALYEHIKLDPRHRDVAAFADKSIEQRAFADWAMAFHPLAPTQALDLLGYVSPANLRLDQLNLRIADQQLVELLRSFVLPSD